MGDTRQSFDLRVVGEGHPIYSCDSMLTVVKVAWDFAAAEVTEDQLLNAYQGIVVTFLFLCCCCCYTILTKQLSRTNSAKSSAFFQLLTFFGIQEAKQ